MALYKVELRGYRVSTTSIPEEGGIYVVYRCSHDKENHRVFLKEMIYIGRNKNNIKQDIQEKEPDFKQKKQAEEEICYSFSIDTRDIDIKARALIFMQKPILNEESEKNNFGYTSSNFIIEGKNNLFKFKRFGITTKSKKDGRD